MLQRLRVMRDDESGFTLVETLVALVVISVVFAAMAGFLVTAVKAQAVNERRVRATQVGNQAVEDLRTLPWNALGFYASDPGYQATHDGAETVTLPEPASARDPQVPLPGTHPVTVGGVTYQRTLHVVWFDDPADGLGAADDDANTHDAKQIITDLSWTVGEGGAKTLTLAGLRAPTIEEVAPRGQGVINPFQVQSFAGSPSPATLDGDGRTTVAIAFTLHTTVAASQVRFSYVDRDGLSYSELMTAPSSNTDWTYTLPVGSGPFETGVRTFSARAYAAAGATADGSAEVEFAASSGTLDITPPTVAPSSVDIDASGRNVQEITVTATATEAVGSMTVTYPTASGTVTASMNLSDANTTGTFTIPAGARTFSAGSFQWAVTASGAGTATRSTTVTFVPPAVVPVEIVGVSVSPKFCAATSSGALHRASSVLVTVNGVQNTDQVQLEFTDNLATKVMATYHSTLANGHRVFRATLNTGTMKWKHVTTPSVITTATRHPDLTQTQRTFPVAVQETNHATNCSAS